MAGKSIFLLSFIFCLFLTFVTIFAACPVCVATTGSMVATARFFGVDDLITGTFSGAFVVSAAFWINRILKKKGKNFIPFQSIIVTICWFFLLIAIFSVAKLITLQFFDRLLNGLLIGTFVTLFAFGFHEFLRKRNGGSSFVPFQIIFITVGFLLLVVFGYYAMGLI